jgi:acetyl-CoA acetyltransferase
MNPHLTSIWTAGAALTSNLRESAVMTMNEQKKLTTVTTSAKPTAAFRAAKKSQAGKYWGDTKPVAKAAAVK